MIKATCKRILALSLACSGHLALAEAPNADALLAAVRFSASQNNLVLPGKLRPTKNNKVEPFQITMNGAVIRFDFTNPPKRSLELRLGQDRGQLLESINGAPLKEVPAKAAGQLIGQTDMNYEDIALAYLYWPNPEFKGEDTVDNLLCWKVRVTNPRGEGPYRHMDLWVEQKAGALVQMKGYNREGRLIKNMTVKDFAKVDKMWMVTKLQVETVDPKDRRVLSRTYMDIKKK